MWQGLQTITDYKGKHRRELPSDTSLPDELNYFYAHFEANNTETCMRAPAVLDNYVITLSTFTRPQGQKDYQDVYCEHALPNCQVSSLIFSTSPLSESVIPTCFKKPNIVPVPKNIKVTCLNDYRLVALTSVAMKCFERLVMAHINTIIPETLDPLQFAYRPHRSTDYAISISLHTALSHLDKRNTDVRMLFIDYSSAFNTIVPSKLISKLRTLGLNASLCNWILDFLMGLPQVVMVGKNTSAVLVLITGDPHGYMLRPSCSPCSPTTAWPLTTPTPSLSLQTTVVGLITDNDETACREEVSRLLPKVVPLPVWVALGGRRHRPTSCH